MCSQQITLMRRAAARAAKEVSLPSDPLLMNHDSIMHGQPPKLGVQIQITVSGTDWRWFRTLDACGKTVLVNIIAIGGIDHIPAQKVIRRQVKWVDFASFAVPFDGWWVAVTERPAIEPAIQPANPERSGADVSSKSVCLPDVPLHVSDPTVRRLVWNGSRGKESVGV